MHRRPLVRLEPSSTLLPVLLMACAALLSGCAPLFARIEAQGTQLTTDVSSLGPAAVAWRQSHPAECPFASQLQDMIPPGAHVRDPWNGGPYGIECEGQVVFIHCMTEIGTQIGPPRPIPAYTTAWTLGPDGKPANVSDRYYYWGDTRTKRQAP